MAREPRYDILFEPVRIGPKTAKNRFYQVPHCNGMGFAYPSSMAAMRGMKAEGGWAVVCTEECEIHWSSEITPYVEMRLWDERDLPAHERMVDAVHAHGALAGFEPVYSGHDGANRYSRAVPMAPSDVVYPNYDPVQARAMDKEDIRAFRRWHREAMRRAKRAGYDILYVYAGHDLCILMHFLLPRYNKRSDEYGGSLENRARLLREVLEDTKEAVGDSCAVAVRLAVDELMGEHGLSSEGEGKEVVELLAELPDLWDVNVSDWANDSATSRFAPEGYQEKYVGFVKKLTSKPVVAVGRYTSPDAMVSLIKRGIADFVGAARPSIADPYLPKKIEEGRPEDIRECIGCNICVTGDYLVHPIRCTQNPTMGEEWRRGWHPEQIARKKSDDRVLVVGAGPAGLEAARALGQRGYNVVLAEAEPELGGRVAREARLPGLAAWARVRDYRVQQLNRMANVEVYRASRLTAREVCEVGAARIALAVGSRWRKDGVGRAHHEPIPGGDGANVFTPDDVMAGRLPESPVLIFDDDHYYMANVLAELLCQAGRTVIFVTPAVEVATWTRNTMEQHRIQARLIELGVELHLAHSLSALEGGEAVLECVYSARTLRKACASALMVTARQPNDALYRELMADEGALSKAGITSVERIGDCLAPASIAHAVYAGHLYAREFDEPKRDGVPFKRELVALSG